jgi:hypothetical protein
VEHNAEQGCASLLTKFRLRYVSRIGSLLTRTNEPFQVLVRGNEVERKVADRGRTSRDTVSCRKNGPRGSRRWRWSIRGNFLVDGILNVPGNTTALLARIRHPPWQSHFLESTGLAILSVRNTQLRKVNCIIPRRTYAQVPNRYARPRHGLLPENREGHVFLSNNRVSLPSCNLLSNLAFPRACKFRHINGH